MRALGTDSIALPMLILLKTKMRIGNEIYYRKNHHKGLTTLKKKNIEICGNRVTFDYIAKDGVPQKITETFSGKIVRELKKILLKNNSESFIFTGPEGRPLKDGAFEKAFEKYCGYRFYPHIVRSHFATKKAQKFLEKKKNFCKKDVEDLYNSIAEILGHKKFSKKEGEWKDSYQVTLHHYINPEIVEKISSMTIH